MEGWHYELESEDAPITYNGVVYNEMKGGIFFTGKRVRAKHLEFPVSG